MSLRQDQHKILLGTDNSADYCDEAGALAPELLAEVEGAAGELTRVADLEEFLNRDNVAPMVAGLLKTHEQLTDFLALARGIYGADAEPPPTDQVVKNAVLHVLEKLVGCEASSR